MLGVLGVSALPSRAAAAGSRSKESSALSWGPARPAADSSSLGLRLGSGLFLLNIWQRLFLYHKFVTKIVQLHDRMKVLPADYKLK